MNIKGFQNKVKERNLDIRESVVNLVEDNQKIVGALSEVYNHNGIISAQNRALLRLYIGEVMVKLAEISTEIGENLEEIATNALLLKLMK